MATGRVRARSWVWILVAGLIGLAPVAKAGSDLLVSANASDQVLRFDGTTGGSPCAFAPGTGMFTAPRGMTLGPDGRLYVAWDSSVRRFDLSTGTLIDEFSSGYPSTIFDLAFGPDGNLYATTNPANVIVRANGSTGALLGTIGPGSPLNSPVGLTFGPDGNLYVASFLTNNVLRFDPATGAYLGVFATVPDPNPTGHPGAPRFGPDGRLYVSLPNGGNDLAVFNGTTGEYIGPFVQAGALHPSGPRFFTWGPDGNLYVAARDTNEVLRYDAATGALIDHFATGSGLSGPWTPLFVPTPVGCSGEVPPPPPLVDTTSGAVQGVTVGGVWEYLGIPYAEAPTGSLRWKRPVRKAHSATTLDATAFGPRCPQMSGSTPVGDEDCLKISLWMPARDPNAPTPPPLPILFYIHGGSHVTGAVGGIIDGRVLALSQNIIVAEVQYRLGALGFFGLPALAAEDPNGSTGNYGVLDQLEAIRWLRDNASVFGGDPNQITIAGQSAGGHSVCALLASPLSDGLFRAAIVDSGQCIYARALDLPATSPVRSDQFIGPTIYDHSTAIAASASCGASDLTCLRGKTAAQIVLALAAQPKLLSGEQRASMAVDGYVLPDTPTSLLRQGAADGRPLLIGSVADEATLFFPNLGSLIHDPASYEAVLRLVAGNTRADALLPIYPAGSDPAQTFRNLFSDSIFVCPTLDDADAVAAKGSPAWVYHMSFAPTYVPGAPNAALGTYHSLDLYYEFGNTAQLGGAGIVVDADDIALSQSMQNAWGSFVRTGVPTTTVPWPVYAPTTPGDLASVSVMLFDSPNHTVPGDQFRAGRCASLLPVANTLDADRDNATYDEDNCPVTANTPQTDAESDSVGDACDNCRNVYNPRVAPDFLTTNPWATLTGGQRDDDHDGYGNICDAKFPGTTGVAVGPSDLAQFRASLNKSRTLDVCGTAGNQPCAIFDLDEVNTAIGPADLSRLRLLLNKVPGPRCPTCPLACTAGTAGSCP